MNRSMADHIRKLLAEARYIQNKREIMELEMSDDEDAEEGMLIWQLSQKIGWKIFIFSQKIGNLF